MKIGNAFLAYGIKKDKPLELDIHYYSKVSDENKTFENNAVVEIEKKKNGMEFLVPPYINHGDFYFWFQFSTLAMPKDTQHKGIEKKWVEIDGEKVLLVNNGD